MVVDDDEQMLSSLLDVLGKARIVADRDKYTGIQRSGPESLRHFRRTYREALKRQISSGVYNPSKPAIVPIREDRRYRGTSTSVQPASASPVTPASSAARTAASSKAAASAAPAPSQPKQP